MRNVLRGGMFVVWTVALVFSSACSGSDLVVPGAPTPIPPIIGGPSPSPTPRTPVLAPPPLGVRSEVWRVAFGQDGRLHRPDAVHLVLPEDADEVTKALFASVANKVMGFIQGKTPIDLIPDPSGVGNFSITVVPNLMCSGASASGCTSAFYNGTTGKIMYGRMEFATLAYMHNEVVAMHETFRTLGLTGLSPIPGIMSSTWVWNQPRPSDEEQIMLLARYDYPLMAQFVER